MPLGSVPISLPLPVNIAWVSDMDAVILLPVALVDKSFVADALEASSAVDISASLRSERENVNFIINDVVIVMAAF